MFRALLLCVFALALASHATALQVVLGGTVGNVTAQQLLQVPSGPYLDSCSQNCTSVNQTINACTDDTCVCTDEIANGLVQCEQCMFNFLVAQNERAPDPRVGSNPALSAFSTACNASVGKLFSTAALVAAPGFEFSQAPSDVVLNTGATVVVVGFGAVMAGVFLMMLSNI